MMTLTGMQIDLLRVVKIFHGDQKRKYTGDPYYVHLLSVANLVRRYVDVPMVVEIALCHDLFEDTECTPLDLIDKLTRIGYDRTDRGVIIGGVLDLTDAFTHKNKPLLNRKGRKLMEAVRLGRTSSLIQSIKYADLIDNTISIVEYDRKFARIYLAEKRLFLDQMRKGNIDLFLKAAWHLQSGLSLLEANVYSKTNLRPRTQYPVAYSDSVPTVESESDFPTIWDDLHRGNTSEH